MPAGGLAQSERQAARFAASGRFEAAAAVFEEILANHPGHVQALAFLSFHAFGRGDYPRSISLGRRACAGAPDDATLRQNLGLAYAAQGDLAEARRALEAALALDPDFALARLHLGGVLERCGEASLAEEAYAQALRLSPELSRSAEDPAAPALIRRAARRALAARERGHREAHRKVLAGLRERFGDPALARVERFVALYHGDAAPEYADPLQRPDWRYFPGLTPRPFFECREFDWISRLEEAFPEIRAELEQVLSEDAGLAAYVPASQRASATWRSLAGSLDWSAYHLLRGGRPVAANAQRCPRTMEVLGSLSLAEAPPHTPEAFFSILKPHTRIPPHHGLSNFKLAVHLGLAIPGNCGIRVGAETRHWVEGRCIVFDDSFEHEAWNESDELRAVLIVEAWNPELTEAERAALAALIAASEQHQLLWEGETGSSLSAKV